MLILRPRLPVMTLLTKRLPVIIIPEQHRISSVRLDMVNNSCRGQFSVSFALRTKWVLCQEMLSRSLPLAAISTFKGTRSVTGVQFDVDLTILTASQSRATGMLARSLGFGRHEH